MVVVKSIDVVSHPIFAICQLDTGKTCKFQKVKPVGSSDATDAAWQTRMQTELVNAIGAAMISGGGTNKNATHHLAGLA
jgi:hypothetical protein